jgi:RNA polymerase sigma-70 factor (ECF subfamily)
MIDSVANEDVRTDDLIVAARGGDERAFRALIDPRVRELEAHCYRMLASAQDAEDVMQEVLLRAWRGLARFEGRSSLRTWLYRVTTHACLNALERNPRRVLEAGGTGEEGSDPERLPAELTWIEPFADEAVGLTDGRATPEVRFELRESVELAFIAALQHLSANQRAVLILREVLGFSAHEVAGMLGATTTAVNSALQHARERIDRRMPDRSQQATVRAVGDRRTAELVTRYSHALQEADLNTLISMITEDATWSMPPTPRRYTGHQAIADFLVAEPFTIRWRHLPNRANGQPSVAWYRHDPQRDRYVAEVLEVLTLRGPQIAAVTAFIGGSRFPRFGLPLVLPHDQALT